MEGDLKKFIVYTVLFAAMKTITGTYLFDFFVKPKFKTFF